MAQLATMSTADETRAAELHGTALLLAGWGGWASPCSSPEAPDSVETHEARNLKDTAIFGGHSPVSTPVRLRDLS
jgi:hypothetical protein